MNSEANNEMNLAWQFVSSTDKSLFLTGKAGTGKTTFLRTLKQSSPKRMVVLAPTGVAAINAQGQTIHSFFQLALSPFVPGYAKEERKTFYRMSDDKKKLIRSLDLLVIDEISMVRCDVLDAVDMEMRKYRDHDKPFGGVQLLMIGDLQQLAPVVKDDEWQLLSRFYPTPYFFSSKALQELDYMTIELQQVYRQLDDKFVNLLGKIRNNDIDDAVVSALNSRFIPGFVPPQNESWIYLTTHNITAQNYNKQRLDEIETTEYTFHAEVKGNFPEYSYPTDGQLVLKVGAQVMFIKNDLSSAHAYYNGKIGIVCGISHDEQISVWCKGDAKPIVVERMEWENTKYVIDEKTKDIKETIDGTFSQFPLRLAWAITVHKSQGLTFDHAMLDVNSSFAHGQVYVALSRCRTLEGMVLTRPLYKASIITDKTVDDYYNNKVCNLSTVTTQLPSLQFAYYKKLLDELFSFAGLLSDFNYYYKTVSRYFIADQPELYAMLQPVSQQLNEEVANVETKFRNQYTNILMQLANGDYANNPTLQERIRKAAIYFSGKMREYIKPVLDKSEFDISDKSQLKQYNNALSLLSGSYTVKLATLEYVVLEGFSIKKYLQRKGRALITETITKKAKHTNVRRQRRKRTP